MKALRIKMGIIYKVTNIINNKSYIGQTINKLERRKYNHIRDAFLGQSDNSYFHRAIAKYGPDQFIWNIICECDCELLDVLETFYIMIHNTHSSSGGYNISWGGGGNRGYKHTDEIKKVIGQHHTGVKSPWLSEMNKSQKMREISSKTHKGKTVSEQSRKKMSESKKLLVGDKSPRYGVKHCEESKQKMSLSQRGKRRYTI